MVRGFVKRFSRRCLWVAVPLFLALAAAPAEEKDTGSEGKSKGLADFFKDLKVPDSVTNFTEDLKEVKKSYFETKVSVEALREEVAALREELEQLRLENALLRKQVESEDTDKELNSATIALTASELAGAYAVDAEEADRRFLRNYVTVTGRVLSFQPGTGEITVVLNSHRDDFQVRCLFRKDASFNVEPVPHQGRLIRLPDRVTLLQVGQSIVVSGTCEGKELDVVMVNCRVESPKLDLSVPEKK